MTGWPIVSLGDAVENVTVGFVGTMASEYRSQGVPFLRSQNIDPYFINVDDLKYIDDSFHERIGKSALRPGDVAVVRTGKPGTAAVIPPWLGTANCSDLVIIRPGPSVNSQWLSYYINGAAQDFISAQLVGAVQQHFNVGAAKRMRMALPPLPEQQNIAEVLGALDDKIAANLRLVERVAGLAMTIFASLQPSNEPQPLTSLARFVNGRAFTKGASGYGRVVIRIAELNSGLGGSTVRSDIDVADDYLARPGDLLFAWSGSLTVARWIRDEAIVNQHIFKVIPAPGVPGWLIHELLNRELPRFKSIAQDKATTMGHIQRHHLDVPVDVPSREAIRGHDEVMTSLADQVLCVERESLQLATLRDTLLPQLMSGRLRVKDAERQVEDVL